MIKETKRIASFAKPTSIEIEGKEYPVVLDFMSAIRFQQAVGYDILEGFQKMGNNDLMALANLMAVVVRDENGEPVGLNFVGKLDLVNSIEGLMATLMSVMNTSMPQAENDSEKK